MKCLAFCSIDVLKLTARVWMTAFLCWSCGAGAQSLLELYRLASVNDPAAASARAQHQATQHRVDQARAAFGLTANLTLNGGRSHYAEPTSKLEPDPRSFTSRQGTLQLTQPLYKPALEAQLQQAKAQGEQARLQSEQSRIDFMLRFVETAFELFKARDALQYLRVEQESTAVQLAQAQRKFAIGTAAATDVRDAEAKGDAVVAQVAAAEYDLGLRHQLLIDLVGRQTPELLRLGLREGALPSVDSTSLPDWVTDAHMASPALRQAQWALEAARQETTKAKAAHLPTVDANYNYIKTWDTGSITSLDKRRADQIQLGVSVTIPLFAAGATRSKHSETIALQDKAQADLETARRELAVKLRQNFSAAQSAMSQAKALTTAVQSQSVAVRASQRAYEVGVKANAEVLAAQSKLSEIKRDLSRSRYDAWLAYFKLKGASGQLDEYDVAGVDGLLEPLDTPMALPPDILKPVELPILKLQPVGVAP